MAYLSVLDRRACQARYDAKHRTERAAWLKDYLSKNPDKRRKYKKTWETSHPDLVKEIRNRPVLELRDRYVRRLLSKGTTINPSTWPKPLVDAKREELRLKRILK